MADVEEQIRTRINTLNKMRSDLIAKGVSEENPVVKGIDAQIMYWVKMWNSVVKP
jgi:hypothetical protein